MNSKLLLALLVLALAGTTWLLVTLVRLPPMGEVPASPDTAAVADPKAVVNPFGPRRDREEAGEGVALPDTGVVAEDTLGVPADTAAPDTAVSDTAASDGAASNGARP